jgi:hypothetical protein
MPASGGADTPLAAPPSGVGPWAKLARRIVHGLLRRTLWRNGCLGALDQHFDDAFGRRLTGSRALIHDGAYRVGWPAANPGRPQREALGSGTRLGNS